MEEQGLELAKVSTGAVARRSDATASSGLVAVEQARAVQEVQAKLIIAKKFPRNETQAIIDISQACKRVSLANVALYTYERGNTKIQGPSIRLAEVIARAWGNVDFGIRELSQSEGFSDVEAYAWDLQTNTTAIRSFKVRHQRYTKAGGAKDLEDPRDIYETVANNGARRMRACILEIIPGDIVEDAVNQVRETLKTSAKAGAPIQDRIKKMAILFSQLGVPVEAIEAKLQHSIDLTTEDELVDMLAIYNSIKDGMQKRTDFFNIGGEFQARTQKPQAPKMEGKKQAEPPKQEAEPPKQADPPPNPEPEHKEEGSTPSRDQLKANLKSDPLLCPKDGSPLMQVDCGSCSIQETCIEVSSEAMGEQIQDEQNKEHDENQPGMDFNPPKQEEDKKPPAKNPPPTRGAKTKDFTLVCGNSMMEHLYNKSVYGRYCQEQCRLRKECPTIKAHGGPTK